MQFRRKEPTRPAGGAKTIKKKDQHTFTRFKNGGRHDISFITSILYSLMILLILLALIGMIYSQKALFTTQ